MSDVTSYHVTGDWRHIVDDGMVDLDALPDEAHPTGKVTFNPVYPSVVAAGVPATAYTLAPVVALIADGQLRDLQGRDGVWLAGKVGEHTVRWNAVTEMLYQTRKLEYPRVSFDLSEDVRLTAIIQQAGKALTPIVLDPRIEALAGRLDDVDQVVVQAEQIVEDAGQSVIDAKKHADRAEGLAVAQDEHVAGVLEDPDSATHAVFKAVGNATYTRGGALQPTCLVEEDVLDMVGNVFVIDRVNDETWGYASGRLYTTPDHGRSWVDRCAAPEASVIRGMIAAPDGEVTAFTNTNVYRSTGWGTPGMSWTLKLTSHGLATFNRFSVGASSDGQRIILGQYGPGAGQAWTDSRYAHITIDGGVTWVQAWDSDTHSGNVAVDSHVHGCGYDEVTDRWFVSEGHSVGAGIWVAEGDGPTWEWTRPEGLRCDDPTVNTGMDAGPTIVMGTDDGMVCGADDVLGGVYGMPRTTRIADLQLNYLYAWRPNRSGTNGFAQRAQRDPETGIVYMVTSSSGPAPVIMGGTAHNAALVWEWPNWAGGASDFIEGLVIEPGGWVVAYGQEAGVRKSILGRVDKPTARSFPDRGGVMGGKSVDPTSIAVGRDADMGLTSTMGGNIQGVVIGNGAKGHTRGITIGYDAQSLGAGAIGIGMGARAGTQGVVIGDRTTSPGVGATLIGYNATAGAGSSSTGIGRNVNVTGTQAVSIGAYASASASLTAAFGYQVAASGLRSTAVGANAASIHSDSVAIGQATVTTGTAQVALGPRNLILGASTAPNGPAVAGGGALWIQDGQLWSRTETQSSAPVSTILAGTTAARPVTTVVGFQYFDTTLGKPIVWNGTAWVDMAGVAV